MENTGWQSADIAQRYRKLAEIVIPGRTEILTLIARMTAAFSPEQPRILELGAGYGALAAAILELCPESTIYLMDFNEEMLRMAEERFGDNRNITVIRHDLDTGLPDGLASGTQDAVVSCCALHHVELNRRVALYRDIHTVLKPGGLFINGDCFIGESPSLNEWEFDNYIAWTVESTREKTGNVLRFEDVKEKTLESDKRLGDKPGTIWEMRRDMLETGFASVDCLWMYLNLGVLAAVKRPADRV